MANLIITIDGPAASGKSTVARLLANKLKAAYLDTGAMYRAVTLAAMRAEADMQDEQSLLGVLDNTAFQFSSKQDKMLVSIDGVDVTEQIRSPKVTANARHIASPPKVREKLVQMQKQFAAGEDKIVTEGRDQGTVAFENAQIKFFLTANINERARRRQAELKARGEDENFEQIKDAIEKRDESDSRRSTGPLKPAQNAVVVDTTDLTIEQVVEKLLLYVQKNVRKKP